MKYGVVFELRTESLKIIWTSFSFKGLTLKCKFYAYKLIIQYNIQILRIKI
jgi:hypothetical protein